MIVLTVLFLGLAAGQAQPQQSSQPLPPAASAVPAVSPAPSGSGAPAQAPPPAASTEPVVYTYRFVPHLPATPVAGQPLIFAVYLNSDTLHSGGVIAMKVVTTPDVVKVATRSAGRGGTVPQVAPGDFEATSKLPVIPIIARGGTVDLDFTASNADGHTFKVTVPVKLR